MATPYAKQFTTSRDADNCNALVNGGSIVMVQNLGECLKEPDVYELGLSAAVTLNGETANIYIETVPLGVATPSLFLQQGLILYFEDTKPVTVAADITITAITSGTAQAVSIDPAPQALLAADTANTWGLIRLLAPKGLDFTINTGKESTTNLNSGLRTKEVVTSLTAEGALSMILEKDDPGFWTVVHRAVTTGKDSFVYQAKPGGSYMWGNAQYGTYSRPGQTQTVQSANLAVMYQDTWLSPEIYKYQVVVDKTLQRAVNRLAGVREIPA